MCLQHLNEMGRTSLPYSTIIAEHDHFTVLEMGSMDHRPKAQLFVMMVPSSMVLTSPLIMVGTEGCTSAAPHLGLNQVRQELLKALTAGQ